jgi:uncharacterized protein YcgI (DUF1989 family)
MSQSAFAGSAMMNAPGNRPAASTTETTAPPTTPGTIEVPPYSGTGVRVAVGSTIRVTNLHGTQIGDMFALCVDNPEEYLDTARTRLMCQRLFPDVGQKFYSNLYRPLLTFIHDSSPGVHDTLYAPCDQGLHELLGATGPHPNCHDNFLSAVAQLNLAPVAVPGPVNLFQATPVDDEGLLSAEPSPAKAGDYVEFKAEADIYLILTACSVDIGSDINGGKSTPLEIRISS